MIPLTHLPIAQNRQLASHHPAGGLICKSSAHDTLYPRVGALPSLQGLARHGSSGPARNFSGPALFNCHPNVRRSAVSMTTVATPEVTTTSEDQAMEPTTLALLGPERASAVQLALEISQLGSEQEYYVWVDDPGASGPGTSAFVLNQLAALYDALATLAPRAICIPLTAATGWNLEKVATLGSLRSVLYAQHQPSADSIPATASTIPGAKSTSSTASQKACAINDLRAAQGLSPLTHIVAAHALDAPDTALDPALEAVMHADYETCLRRGGASDVATPCAPSTRLRYSRVAVGGTFDRLHAGHEMLLAATSLIAEQYVFVGVTGDALLASKSHKELLQSYDARAGAAVAFLRRVHPQGASVDVQAGPLLDPKAPTIAELDPAMQALVVSHETLPGGQAINAGRAARGFAPLDLLVVPLLGMHGRGGGAAGAQGKLSSSELRARESEEQRQRGSAQQQHEA